MTNVFRTPRSHLGGLLLLLAIGVMLIGPAARRWNLDHDNGGRHPVQDCGRNYWLNLFVESGFGKEGCAPVNVVRAENIDDEATAEMKANGKKDMDIQDALDEFYDTVGQILERIAPAW